MRCPDCNKFVGYDQPDPEVNDVTVDGDTVRASVRVVLNCAECSTELKEAEVEAEAEIDSEILEAHPEKDDAGNPTNHSLEVEEGSIDPTDRTEGKGRGMRTFYGFELEATLSCSCGGPIRPDGEETEETINLSGDVQASSMDEVC